jgi:hypothetical protein
VNIIFSPVRRDDALTLSKAGDTLTLNGEAFDFSGVLNGATLPREAITCDWIAGDVERDRSGVLTVPLILPHGPDASEAARFPTPLEDVADGPLDMSIYGLAIEEEEA